MNQNMQIIHLALKSLASVCDGANAEDGQGYNGVDTGFGKQLARQQTISLGQAKAALKMLKKYKGQLTRFGITLPATAEDDAEKTFSYNINRDWIVIYFNHIPSTEVRELLKGVKGYKYCPEKNNSWVYRNTEEAYHMVQVLMDIVKLESVNGVEYKEEALAF